MTTENEENYYQPGSLVGEGQIKKPDGTVVKIILRSQDLIGDKNGESSSSDNST